MSRKASAKTLGMVQLALLGALIFILAFTPFLGYIPLGVTRATIIHVPVIIGSLLLGPKKGAALGFLFGLTSLLSNTMTPAITSFTFTPFYPLPGTDQGTWLSLIVCFLPRILVGVVPYYVYIGLQKLFRAKKEGNLGALAVAGVAGAMTNTIGVMGLIFLLFRDAYAAAKAVEPGAVLGIILGIVGFNGVIEAIGAGILVGAVGKVLFRFREKSTR